MIRSSKRKTVQTMMLAATTHQDPNGEQGERLITAHKGEHTHTQTYIVLDNPIQSCTKPCSDKRFLFTYLLVRQQNHSLDPMLTCTALIST